MDESSLAFGGFVEHCGLRDFLLGNSNSCSRERRFPHLVIMRHSDTPVGDGTLRILFSHALERFLGSLVSEGMEKRNRTIELLLRSRLARG
jgi:hypothetical protein